MNPVERHRLQGRFRRYVLREQNEFLGRQVGDILSALQSLSDDSASLGSRQMVRVADQIVDDMRRVLKGRWPAEEYQSLEELQKVAVFLKKSCDTNAKPLPDVVRACKAAVQALAGRLGTTLNDAGGDLGDVTGDF